jgi:hypothetical protein
MKLWIRHVEDGEATGQLKEFYERVRNPAGRIPDNQKVLSIRPEVAIAKEQLRRTLLGEASTLGARRADMISVVVSGLNGCRF